MHQFLDTFLKRIGCLMNALDALQSSFELHLALADLRLHGGNQRFAPGVDLTIGTLENSPDLMCDFIEETFCQLLFLVCHELEGGVQVCVAPRFQSMDILLLAR